MLPAGAVPLGAGPRRVPSRYAQQEDVAEEVAAMSATAGLPSLAFARWRQRGFRSLRRPGSSSDTSQYCLPEVAEKPHLRFRLGDSGAGIYD